MPKVYVEYSYTVWVKQEVEISDELWNEYNKQNKDRYRARNEIMELAEQKPEVEISRAFEHYGEIGLVK